MINKGGYIVLKKILNSIVDLAYEILFKEEESYGVDAICIKK